MTLKHWDATDHLAHRRIVRNLMAVEIRCAEEAVGAQTEGTAAAEGAAVQGRHSPLVGTGISR